MNIACLVGRCASEPELRFLPETGKAVTKFSIAIDRNLSKDKKRELEQKNIPTADFPRIVIWGKQAEYVAEYLRKGKLVSVQGRITTGSYENSQGNRVYTTEVTANPFGVKVLEYSNSNNNNDTGGYEGYTPIDDDDIPF